MADTGDGRDAVVIERTFEAPRDLVWRMWTDPEHFKVWYGPDGVVIPVARMDVRVGGERVVCMEVQTPDGPMRMWFTGEHREVVVNERLVYTESMSDESRAADAHPTATEVRVELEDLGDRTRMVMTHQGIPPGSPGATGWTMAFDKLAAHVEGRRDRERS
jgi:uncharacterized protein YndB with AHSA1/START domain